MVQCITRLSDAADPGCERDFRRILVNVPGILGRITVGRGVGQYVVAMRSLSGRLRVPEEPGSKDQEIAQPAKKDAYDRLCRAFAVISENEAPGMWGRIRSRFRWLPPEDLRDAWQTAVLTVWEKIATQELAEPDAIAPMLWTVFRCRCCDVLTREGRCKRGLERLRQTLQTEGLTSGLEAEEGADEWAVVYHLVDKGIQSLSPVRRAVWIAYRDLGYSATIEQLANHSERTRPDREWTIDAVRRARQEGRDKLRKFLKKRGYPW